MEFFHEPKIDWMGKKWYFIGLSIPLLLAGMISIAVHRGLNYGIDFRGGTQVTVKFAQEPNLDAIRNHLDQSGLHGATLQGYGPVADHEVIVGVDLKDTEASNKLDAGKKAIVDAMGTLYPANAPGKQDFNNANASTIADDLITADPLHMASKGTEEATKAYKDLATAMTNFRDEAPRKGLIGDVQELSSVQGVTPDVIATLKKDFYVSPFAVTNAQIVGPKVGADLRRQALYVTLAGLGAMLVYIWYRFELVYGVAAVIATFHDVLITIGFFSLLNKEITLTVIAALLTLVGYSMNDTIVVFDRIRENVKANKRENILDVVNRSINQTLSRTILTSGLTFLAVLSLYLFGGEVINGFAFALVVGVIIGTYSSIAIASPVLVFWQQRLGGGTVGASPKPKVLERETAGARR
jgi:preprotein translocase subunit SecF